MVCVSLRSTERVFVAGRKFHVFFLALRYCLIAAGYLLIAQTKRLCFQIIDISSEVCHSNWNANFKLN